jgi:hypothetical protein
MIVVRFSSIPDGLPASVEPSGHWQDLENDRGFLVYSTTFVGWLAYSLCDIRDENKTADALWNVDWV